MRKAILAGASGIALVAFLGLNGQALAVTDSSCDGDPYSNDPALRGFTLDTVGTHLEHAPAGVVASGVACGSELTLEGGDETLYDHADISVAPGVRIANTSRVPEGSFVGTASVNILYRLAGLAWFAADVPSTLKVDDIASCETEAANLVGGPSPGEIVACYYGSNFLGHNWDWSTRDENHRYTNTVGPMHGVLGVEPGLTALSMSFCRYFGAPGTTTCGSGGQWIQRNGARSVSDCADGNGVYEATATRRDGLTTAPASDCVSWSGLRLLNEPAGGTGKQVPYGDGVGPLKPRLP